MFIDLVGSTTLSQQLDPEDYHARVVAYQAACRHIVARYEGHIAQYLGDGVLVYFGYPQAHEEDAVRAVRSGLEIVTAVSQLAYTPPLQVRIGIHTGPVVVGEIGAGETNVLATTIAQVSYFGDLEQYELKLPSGLIVKACEQNPSSIRRKGEPLMVHIKPENIMVIRDPDASRAAENAEGPERAGRKRNLLADKG